MNNICRPILWLNDDVVNRLLPPQRAVGSVRSALICHANHDYQQPLKPYIRPLGREDEYNGGRFIAMPAFLGGDVHAAGIKWISGFPANVDRGLPRASGLYILNSAEDGVPIAIMQCAVLSARRTAAVASLAVTHLAGSGQHIVGLLGCGPIGTEVIRALTFCNRSCVSAIRLYDPRTQRAEQLAANFSADLSMTICRSLEECLQEASVLILATAGGAKGYLTPELVGRKRLIVSLSLDDASPELLLSADKLVVDDFEQANREEKLLHRLIRDGRISRESVYGELGEIVAGIKPARLDDNEMIYLNPMGMAIEDLAVAHAVYEAAIEDKAGTWLM